MALLGALPGCWTTQLPWLLQHWSWSQSQQVEWGRYQSRSQQVSQGSRIILPAWLEGHMQQRQGPGPGSQGQH